MAVKQLRPGQKSQTVATSGARARRVSLPNDHWIVPVWTLIAASATIAMIVVAWLQWKSLGTVEHALNGAQRPWLGAAVEPLKLVFDDKGGGITLKITTKNSGASPATDILAGPVLLLREAKHPFNIGTACSQSGIAGGFGLTLFKDEASATTTTAWISRADFGQNFPTLVAVCIKYRFADRSQAGETGYLFAIARRDPAHPDVTGIEPNNGTIEPPDLALLPRGSYAY